MSSHTVLIMSIWTLTLTGRAHPEVFGLVPVESIVSPPDEMGEIGYSTSDMVLYAGWYPTDYDTRLLESVFGPPTKVAPDVRGWAFALDDAPDFGVVLIPGRRGRALPFCWDWGMSVPPGRDFEVGRRADFATSAWLNALAHFEREVAPALGDAE